MYKKYQRMTDPAVDDDLEVVDFKRGLTDAQKQRIVPVDTISSDLIDEARKSFEKGHTGTNKLPQVKTKPEACTVFEHQDFPGNSPPSLLPWKIKLTLLRPALIPESSSSGMSSYVH